MKTKRGKFKKDLVKHIKEEKQEQLHQEHLKDKYKVQDSDVVIVEKANTIKFMTKTIIAVIKLTAAIALFLLSVVGLAALIYPESRNILIHQAMVIYNDLLRLLAI